MDAPLVNMAAEGSEWLEWAAALYESYAADYESDVYWTTSYSNYAAAAQRAAETLEYAQY